MKVLQKGKEVKGAQVFYDANGGVQHVQVEGVNYDAKAFELVDDEAEKQTKPASRKGQKTSKPAAPQKRSLKDKLSGVFSTEDVKRK